MSIHRISFDARTFRHSPHTRHDRVANVGIFIANDSGRGKRHGHMISLDEKFSAAAVGETGDSPILNVSLSGLKADPNIDFSLGTKKISVKAVDYIVGFLEYCNARPPGQIDPKEPSDVSHAREKQWSVAFFRERLAELVTAPDEFFYELYSGIDDAMGDSHRVLIIMSRDSPRKQVHGSYEPPDQNATQPETGVK